MPEEKDNGRGRQEVMRLVGALSRLFREEVRGACGRNGVPVGYRGLLFHLAEEDGQTQKSLAEKTGLKAATVSITIEKMERDGYVSRQRDGRDGRAMRVYLTDKGKEIDRRIKEKIGALEKQFASVLTQEEQERLSELLCRMIDGCRARAGQRGADGERDGAEAEAGNDEKMV